jgi:UDP-N-acetyl-D-mannosaminuronate dehydrogenase
MGVLLEVNKMNYIKDLEVCIDEKLINYCIENNKSVLSTDMKYRAHVRGISQIYRNPQEHYSKILAMAYHKTIKDMRLSPSLDFMV